MDFTADQLEAIGFDGGNLQLIACAGSGKTEVVARRIAAILKKGASPGSIVAFTFTDKAAAELKDRIYGCCLEELGHLTGMADIVCRHNPCVLHRPFNERVPGFLEVHRAERGPADALYRSPQ